MAATPLRRLCHWGPLSVLGIIKLVTWAMVHLLGMWWPPHTSLAATLHAALFLFLAAATLYYFLQSLLEGPGFVPLGWKPEHEEDTNYLQFCTVCNGFKAPRSHHCRKCGYCVKKMDHHCPWINCCVGHKNHGYFTLFLISAVLGCLHASIVLTICMYHAINRVWYVHNGTGREPMIYLTLTTLLLTLLAIGMAVGVVLAVGVLLYLQIRGIFRNQTMIEDWIVEKAAGRREEQGLPGFVFPYNVGWRRNVKLVLYPAKHDGIKWPVRDGCGEYDLTNVKANFLGLAMAKLVIESGEFSQNSQREQQAQKQDKRVRSRLYRALEPYSGRWVPLWSRPRAACGAPCTDEPRLPLKPGDLIRATRQRRHWLFGEKLVGDADGTGRGPRGWFPRAAAVPSELTPKTKPD